MPAAPDDAMAQMTGLPEDWRTFSEGTPVPNWVAALQASRNAEARAINGHQT